jgi:Ulp1 family protease
MDPSKVNEQEIRDQWKITIEIIYRNLDELHYKEHILLPYNYKWACIQIHWILLIITIDKSNINVYDSLRKYRSEYQDLQDVFHE